MASVKEINIRIDSLKNTKKITEAMKLIAITKLNRAKTNVKNGQSYYEYLKKISETVKDVDFFKENELISERNLNKKIKLIVFTSDKGLCGPFNLNIIKKTNAFIKEKKGLGLDITAEFFGKRGYDFFKKDKAIEVGNWYEDVFKNSYDFSLSKELVEKNINSFLNHDFDEFYIIYSRFVSVLKQIPLVKRIVPLQFEEIEGKSGLINDKETKKSVPNFLFEPNKKEVIEQIIRKMMCFEFYFGYLNTLAGEHSSRMTAMDNATNNCSDMMESLTLERNQLRQANITKELIEIISGAESV